MPLVQSQFGEAYVTFRERLRLLPSSNLLEMGTRRWSHESTHHRDWFDHVDSYTKTDFLEGPDVDIVSDAHDMVSVFGTEKFDAIICFAVFEHLKKPWIVADQMRQVLKPGGLFYVQTHQTFPLHGYPSDYFRFSTPGLRVLFEDCDDLSTNYEFPCRIDALEWVRPPADRDCYLNSCITGRRGDGR